VSQLREKELQALRDACPFEWLDWARENGSETLKRALCEGYPFAALLRTELLAFYAPHVEGTERADMMTDWRIEVGTEREPNELSFELLDRIQANARAAFTHGPHSTALELQRLRRVSLTNKAGDTVYASSAGIAISCSTVTLTATFIWGRSDALKRAGGAR
jgi:hypothetical protein